MRLIEESSRFSRFMRENRRRWALVAGVLACTSFGSACDSSSPVEPTDVVFPFQPVYPNVHAGPDWSRQGLLVYEDIGVSCVDSLGRGYWLDTTRVGLWVLDPSTSSKRRINSFGLTPSWSADGSRIAFATPWTGALYTLSSDGSDLRQVTPANANFVPRWSPDGTRLAWAQRSCPGCGVYVADSDGGNPQLILPDADFPDWNPAASDTLLCTRWEPGGTGQYLVAVSLSTGGSRTVLRTLREYDYIRSARYSPDGRSIAFVRTGDLDRSGLYVLGPGATEPVALLKGRVGDCSWSPAGDRITYLAWDWLAYSRRNGTLWSIEVESRSLEQLTYWPSSCISGATNVGVAWRNPLDLPYGKFGSERVGIHSR